MNRRAFFAAIAGVSRLCPGVELPAAPPVPFIVPPGSIDVEQAWATANRHPRPIIRRVPDPYGYPWKFDGIVLCEEMTMEEFRRRWPKA